MIVTIDGPAGTGKSTVARVLAEMLGFQFLDTGSMYRMIAWRSISAGISPERDREIEDLTACCRMDLSNGLILLDGADVSGQIRTVEVTRLASLVAQIPRVRELLVQRQREIADSNDIVCEGRDQGTVAFPHAQCKFYLTAHAEERARRRQAELAGQGQLIDFDTLLEEQKQRDQRDAERAVAPLRPAADALIIDTTSLAMQEVVDLLRQAILNRQSS